jgi:hypothetical protein
MGTTDPTHCHVPEVLQSQNTVHKHVQRPTIDKTNENVLTETQIRYIKMYLNHQNSLETAKFNN